MTEGFRTIRASPSAAPARSRADSSRAGVPSAEDVLDSLRDQAIFTLDADGIITTWNESAHRLAGYSAAEAIGRSYSIFSQRDSAGEVERMLRTAQDRGVFRQERWWRCRDAGLVWVDETIQPFEDDGYIVVARDVTEPRTAEERTASRERGDGEHALRTQLQTAERRAAFLSEASSILVATSLDSESTLRALARLAVSRIADWCAIHTLGDGSLVRTEVAHRDPELEAQLRPIVDSALNSRWEKTVLAVASTGQSQIQTKLTPNTWFEKGDVDQDLLDRFGSGSAMITPLMGRGNVLGAITLVSTEPGHTYDEEELALAEELGRRAAIALDNARLYRQAQEANRAKADFLAVVSHELRTPLNAIMGYSDLLDAGISGELSDQQHRQLDRIRASARHLLQLIEEILSFARIEAGGEEVKLLETTAAEVAEEASAIIEPLAAAKGLEYIVDVPADLPGFITDPDKLRQILVNLLSNAVKFTERGSVKLAFRTSNGQVHFDIIDTGIGIPEDQLDRIFDPFWQVERPNTRRVGGTGLGLSVSRRFVRLLHGDITVSSEPGRGTHFTVSLPLREHDGT